MSSDVIRSTLMVPQKIRYLRYASFLVIAEYPQVRLIPRDLQALISALFTKPSEMRLFTGLSTLDYHVFDRNLQRPQLDINIGNFIKTGLVYIVHQPSQRISKRIGGELMSPILKIGIIGDYQPNLRYHMMTEEALSHAASALSISLTPSWVSTISLENDTVAANLCAFHGLWCAPGDYKSMNGALEAIKFARKQEIPFVGT